METNTVLFARGIKLKENQQRKKSELLSLGSNFIMFTVVDVYFFYLFIHFYFYFFFFCTAGRRTL